MDRGDKGMTLVKTNYLSFLNFNPGHNILILSDVLPNFLFTTIEVIHNY